MKTTYAIGDVHGCKKSLSILLKKIHKKSPEANFIFLGDLINKGPQSLDTLRMVYSMRNYAKIVLGNHEIHLLDVLININKKSKLDTFDDILDAPDKKKLVSWLRTQPLAIYYKKYLMIHAGVAKQWTSQQTIKLSHQVEKILRTSYWKNLFFKLYNHNSINWDNHLHTIHLNTIDKLQFIINTLTRTRFCKIDGTIEFIKKNIKNNNFQNNYIPWFDLPNRKTIDITVLFGHWSTLGLIMKPNIICLDTGCVWGNKLTALCLEDRSIIQVNNF